MIHHHGIQYIGELQFIQLSRIMVKTYEESLFFETIEEMFKDWQKVEDLVIYDEA